MAETTTTISRPSPYVEAFGKALTQQVGKQIETPVVTGAFAPTVAGVDPFTQQAQQQMATGAGLGALTYDATGAVSGVGAGTGIGAYEPYLETAGTYAGPTGYQQFTSPYQQDVLQATMDDYDAQAQKGLAGIGQQAALSGQFLGGGREGVQRAEYQALSDRNRASMLAQLRQQMFGQAQQGAQTAYGQQMQMGQAVPQLQSQDISTLGQLGGIQQAQEQAQLGATQEANRMTAMEPYDRLGIYGQGVTGLISGYPGQYQSMSQPNPTALQTALGTASVLGGIYGNVRGNTQAPQVQQQQAQRAAGIPPWGGAQADIAYHGW